MTAPTTTARPVSDAQRAKIAELLDEKQLTSTQAQFVAMMTDEMTSTKEASAVITFLVAMPNKPGIVPAVRARVQLFDPAEPGVYELDGQRYLVRFSKKRNQWYANEMDGEKVGKYLGKQIDLAEAVLIV